MFTSLTSSEHSLERTETLISSLMDTWILVATELEGRHRNRQIYVLKSRGMPHSDDVRSFSFSPGGIQIEGPARSSIAKPLKRAAHATQRTRVPPGSRGNGGSHSRASARRRK
jgi:circadian clock protein KaiC